MPGPPENASGTKPWVVVLAGGEGARLRGMRLAGRIVDRPKQFYPLVSNQTLLAQSLARADRVGARERVLISVCEAHRRWWEPALADRPPGTAMVQPHNRGTALAILQALLLILGRDDEPVVVVLPSDHAVDPESAMIDGLNEAVRAARDRRDAVVLLGATPRRPEPDYGWIVPGRAQRGVQPVVDFVEKPGADRAASLLRRGALWSTFALAASGRALLELFEFAQPALLERFLLHWDRRIAPERALEQAVLAAPSIDFSRDVLQRTPSRLSVTAMPDGDWTDLGTPERVEAWLDRLVGV